MRAPLLRTSLGVGQRRSCRGFSLVELMVALTLGLILTVIIGYAYLGSRQAFRVMETLSRIQENARYTFDKIGYDIRMAGFTGCSFNTIANVLNNPTDWDTNLFGVPLVGYEEGGLYPVDISANVLRGDALTVLRADNSKEYIVASHNPPAAQLQLTANHDIKQGEILVITDCRHAAIFQMTNVNNTNSIDVIVHNSGNATNPGNCTKGLGNPVPDPCTANGTAYTFAPGSRILRLSAVTYYLRNNTAGEPALYRQKLGASGGNAVTTAEELAEGVEDLQITYGVDTSAPEDKAVDTYVAADSVADWSRVLTVRISLLMVSRQGESITSSPQTYTFNGTTTTPTDRLLRKTFTTTISVRNRL
ncbi:PilW family protein [Methylocaldum sp.]|uniref:PilW family protein n=1 Tax=Methylocaldum sp. TaxID=1969727 RepID=UPI002D33244D|nr:PilW family protein [Methylocaldum sp.]HYE34439.1 PilW family protein [Methylocaldum sp.]